MILVEPEYLPSVNYFKIFSDNQVTIDYDVKFSDNPFFNRSRLVGDTGVFEIKIPTVDNSSTYLRDIKIDYSKNWINSHIQSIQSAYGKYPYYIYYKDHIINKIKLRHNFLIDLNCDLLTLFCNFLNFENKIFESDNKNQKSFQKTRKKPITFLATVNCIVYAGAEPDFVDIDSVTYTIDPNLLEEKVKKYQDF